MNLNETSGVVAGTTCFKEHKERNINCKQSQCRYWQSGCKNNCIMISAENKEMTLQEIGDIFGVTRMRICQIEKIVINKLKKISKSIC